MNVTMIKKTMIIILIFFILSLFLSSKVYALDGLDSILDAGKSFIDSGKDGTGIIPEEKELVKLSKSISNVLLTVAIGVTLVSTVVMGINFLIQSVEEKAKIKESMIPWIVGIAISFGSYTIWNITMKIFYGLNL